MERLTHRIDGRVELIIHDFFDKPASRKMVERSISAALEKLAEYEDLGLTPEEIADMKYRIQSLEK